MLIQEKSRTQGELFFSLDDMIDKENIVRKIDLIAKHLIGLSPDKYNLRGQNATGRPAFSAEILLKLYCYGCINRITTSRRLEKETQRNIELMWLIGNLKPDHKTISDFRKQNKNAIDQFNLDIKKMLKSLFKFDHLSVATDGTKLKANASRDIQSNNGSKELLARLEREFAEYIALLDENDNEEISNEAQTAALTQSYIKKVNELEARVAVQKSIIAEMESKSKNYYSQTDPDCSLMKSRDGMIPGFNVQVTVDTEHHFILNESVSDDGNDLNQLLPAQEALRKELDIVPEEHLADTGYCNFDVIQSIESNDGTKCFTPVSVKKSNCSSITFTYDRENDQYKCSQGKVLQRRWKNKRAKKSFVSVYIGSDCKGCQLYEKCTKSKEGRNITRFWNQDYRDAFRLKSLSVHGKEKSLLRKSSVEHVFGTMKLWMGKIPLSTRGMEAVETEINIFSTAYNIKRLSSIMTYDELEKKLRAYSGKIAQLTKNFALTGKNIFKKLRLAHAATIPHHPTILIYQIFVGQIN